MPTEPPVYCPRCDKVFLDMVKLKKHIDKAHPEYDPNWDVE